MAQQIAEEILEYVKVDEASKLELQLIPHTTKSTYSYE